MFTASAALFSALLVITCTAADFMHCHQRAAQSIGLVNLGSSSDWATCSTQAFLSSADNKPKSCIPLIGMYGCVNGFLEKIKDDSNCASGMAVECWESNAQAMITNTCRTIGFQGAGFACESHEVIAAVDVGNTQARCCGITGVAAPTTTPPPTTAQPTTAEPTTAQPTTAQPTTAEPTTAEPTTAEPTTAQPTTAQPTTAQPTTAEPTTAEPTTAQPTTAQPTTAEPTTAQPTTAEPTTAEPTTAEPKPVVSTPEPSHVPQAAESPVGSAFEVTVSFGMEIDAVRTQQSDLEATLREVLLIQPDERVTITKIHSGSVVVTFYVVSRLDERTITTLVVDAAKDSRHPLSSRFLAMHGSVVVRKVHPTREPLGRLMFIGICVTVAVSILVIFAVFVYRKRGGHLNEQVLTVGSVDARGKNGYLTIAGGPSVTCEEEPRSLEATGKSRSSIQEILGPIEWNKSPKNSPRVYQPQRSQRPSRVMSDDISDNEAEDSLKDESGFDFTFNDLNGIVTESESPSMSHRV